MHTLINFIAHLICFFFLFFTAVAIGEMVKQKNKKPYEKKAMYLGVLVCITIYVFQILYIR